MAYYYSILSFFSNLNDPSTEMPIAILVESRLDNNEVLCVVRKEAPPGNEQMSLIGQKMGTRAWEILEHQILQCGNKTRSESLLEFLSKNNMWNFRISFPKEVPTEGVIMTAPPIEIPQEISRVEMEMMIIAFSLFVQHILKKDFLLNQFIRSHEQRKINIESPMFEWIKTPATPDYAVA